METVLMVAVVVITLAVIAQAGVLLAMYMLSRRLTGKVEVLMNESQTLITPLESITSNLTSASNDLAETGKIAREQIVECQEFISEARDMIRGQIFEVREMVLDTVDEARDTVMKPIRHYSAIANAVAVGVRTFFSRKKATDIHEIQTEREYPAA